MFFINSNKIKKEFNIKKMNKLKEEDFEIYNNIGYCIKNDSINKLFKLYKIEKIYKIISGYHGKINRGLCIKYINILLYDLIKSERYNILSYIIKNEIKQHNNGEWDKYIKDIKNESNINKEKYLTNLTSNLINSYYNGFISIVSLFSPFSMINIFSIITMIKLF